MKNNPSFLATTPLLVAVASLVASCRGDETDVSDRPGVVIQPPSAAPLPLTPDNYQTVLARSYRLITAGGLSGFAGESPDADQQICISGSQGRRLIDRDGSNSVSVNDEVEKSFAECSYDSGNGPARLNGTMTYRLLGLHPDRSASLWTVETAPVNFRLVDVTSSECKAICKLSFLTGNIEKKIGGSNPAISSYEALSSSITRDDWLGSVNLRFSGTLRYDKGSSGAQDAFAFFAEGELLGDTVFGYSTVISRSSNGHTTLSIGTNTPLGGRTSVNGGFASTGQLVVKGDRSGARLSPQDQTGMVLVELDADGNGTYEVQQTSRWAELTTL